MAEHGFGTAGRFQIKSDNVSHAVARNEKGAAVWAEAGSLETGRRERFRGTNIQLARLFRVSEWPLVETGPAAGDQAPAIRRKQNRTTLVDLEMTEQLIGLHSPYADSVTGAGRQEAAIRAKLTSPKHSGPSESATLPRGLDLQDPRLLLAQVKPQPPVIRTEGIGTQPPGILNMGRPNLGSQNRLIPSHPLVTNMSPPPLKAAAVATPMCPSKTASTFPAPTLLK